MKKIVSIIIVLLIPFANFSQAKKLKKYGLSGVNIPRGVKVGEKAPTFKAVDQNGFLIDLNSMLRDGPVVLIFYRGYWCPFCSKALKNYADSINLVTDKGVWFIAVSPETTLGVSKTIEETNLRFSVVSDQDEKIMRAYDVAFDVSLEYQ
ncbi:MAG: peroxiredoxin family protein, partial [Bacteroidales bacterium]|nr:peroxiredoxin family protein [Bacteroidales bacterium]